MNESHSLRATFGVCVSLILIIFLFLFSRPVALLNAETNHQVYETSQAHEHGKMVYLMHLCTEMNTQPNFTRTLGGLIRKEKVDYHGPIEGNLLSCFDQIEQR